MNKNLLTTLLVFGLAIFAITAFRAWSNREHIIPPAFAQQHSLPDASAASTQDGRPVLVFVTADWCGPCQSFKRGALSDPAITELFTAKAHPVLLDADTPSNGAESLKIFSIPALLLLKNGREVARLEGGVNASELTSWFNAALAKP